MSKSVKVATIAINQTVGDWDGNLNRITQAILQGRSQGIKLLLFPEMCISGYSLGDRLLMQGTLRRSWQMLEEIALSVQDEVVVVGLPIEHRNTLYNVAAVVANGRICGLVPKENLATGDVEYESRWYASWLSSRVESYVTEDGLEIPMGGLVFQAKGIGKFAIEVCEDGWKGIRPGSRYALAGATILLNPSASWFTIGKQRTRRHMIEQTSREDICAYLYTSLMGCDSTRLIFDGASFIAVNGQIVEEGSRFVFTEKVILSSTVVDVSALERARLEMGSWRQQSEQLNHGVYGELPPIVQIDGIFDSKTAASAVSPYWQTAPEPPIDSSLEHHVVSGLISEITWRDLPHIELEMALALGLQEYIHKCGIRKVALALSGGRDSTMCAVLLRRMVDYQNPTLTADERRSVLKQLLVTAYMGTENSGSATRNAAKYLAEELGAVHYDGDIQAALETHLEVFKQMTGIEMTWAEEQFDLPLQNVQARLRGSLIWMVANVHNALLLTTSNKSEAAVGYTTMDGDTSGGLAPIADVPKSLVIEWLNWAAGFHSYDSIALVSQMPSTAELRPQDSAQTDEDDLMPFIILDQLMYHFVQLGLEPLEICQRLWPTVATYYGGKIHEFGLHIELFTKKICFAQWKRERFAISFRVTSFDLDPKTGFRFPPVQSPFRVELTEMWEWIGQQDC